MKYLCLFIITAVFPVHGYPARKIHRQRIQFFNSLDPVLTAKYYSGIENSIRVRRQDGYKYEKPSISFDLPSKNEVTKQTSSGQSGYPSNESNFNASPVQPSNLYAAPETSQQVSVNTVGGYDQNVPSRPEPTYSQPSQPTGDGYPSKNNDDSYDYSAQEKIKEIGSVDVSVAEPQYNYPNPETSTPGKPYLPPKIEQNSVPTNNLPISPNIPSNLYTPSKPVDTQSQNMQSSDLGGKYIPPNTLESTIQNESPQNINNEYGPPSNSPSSGYAPASNSPTSSNAPTSNSPSSGYAPASNSPSSGYAPPSNSPNSGNAPSSNSPSSGNAPPSNSPSSGYAPSSNSPTSGYAPSSKIPTSGYVPPLKSPNSGYPQSGKSPPTGFAPPGKLPTSGYITPAKSSASGYAPPTKSPTSGNVSPPRQSEKPNSKYVPPSNKYVPPSSAARPTPAPFVPPISTPASTYLPPYQ